MQQTGLDSMAKRPPLGPTDPEPKRRGPRQLSTADLPIDDDLAVFGRNLKVARLSRVMTLLEVAAASGLTVQYVSKVEHGRANLTLASMKKLAAAVGHDVRLVEACARPLAQKKPKP